MTQWRWNVFTTPYTKTINKALSVFEKVFREDAMKKEAAKESQDQPGNNSRRGILKHIFGIFN
ncbi:MAG: hypothetical protein V1721_05940 [Pseudomonadota bacterium]